MTNAEIIKALEEWIKELKEDYKRLQLLDAPMDCFEESHIDNIRILSNIFDLINRQKAEIERLNGLLEEWKKAGYKYADSFDSIKSETIKEFAEKLKDKLQHRALFSVNDTIDEIVKEMAGVTE